MLPVKWTWWHVCCIVSKCSLTGCLYLCWSSCVRLLSWLQCSTRTLWNHKVILVELDTLLSTRANESVTWFCNVLRFQVYMSGRKLSSRAPARHPFSMSHLMKRGPAATPPNTCQFRALAATCPNAATFHLSFWFFLCSILQKGEASWFEFEARISESQFPSQTANVQMYPLLITAPQSESLFKASRIFQKVLPVGQVAETS